MCVRVLRTSRCESNASGLLAVGLCNASKERRATSLRAVTMIFYGVELGLSCCTYTIHWTFCIELSIGTVHKFSFNRTIRNFLYNGNSAWNEGYCVIRCANVVSQCFRGVCFGTRTVTTRNFTTLVGSGQARRSQTRASHRAAIVGVEAALHILSLIQKITCKWFRYATKIAWYYVWLSHWSCVAKKYTCPIRVLPKSGVTYSTVHRSKTTLPLTGGDYPAKPSSYFRGVQ